MVKGNFRVDAEGKVNARTEFLEDRDFGKTLHGATIRSPVSHGKYLGIENLDEIRDMPGVRAVVTSEDIPGNNYIQMVKRDYPCLADNELKFIGQPVALVAADTVEEARSAARHAKVMFKEYPAVYDPLQAIRPDSVYVGGDDNIHSTFRIRKGDVARAFSSADITVEGVFSTGHQVHCYLENQGVLARPTASGGIVLYGSLQCPFYVHNALVAVTGLTYSKIRVIQTTTGGGFGGKEDVPSILASHASLLVLKTGKPVSLVYDRQEDFNSMSKRHPSRTRIKYGAMNDGRIVACDSEYIVNGGAFCTLSPIVAWRGIIHITGPYDIPNVKADAYAVATNTVPCGAFRGFGQPQVNLANECLIDELAEKLGMDPVELRKKNLLKQGSITATGQTISESCGMEEALEKTLQKIGYGRKRKRETGPVKKGIGISTTFYGVGLGAEGRYFAKAGAEVQVKEDGSAVVAIGNVEMGQGAETVINRICADTLGCPYDMVEVLEPDTTRVPDSGPTVASRTTMVGGRAVMDAAGKIRDVIKKSVAKKLGVEPSEIRIEGNSYVCSSGKLDYAEAVSLAYADREPMAAQGWFKVEGVTYDTDTGKGDPYPVYTFSANACEVKVDTETGQVEVTRFVSAHDIGKAIHAPSAEGQIQGGVMQAIGYALYENLVLEDGRVVNPSFSGYTMPTILDACDIEPIIVEHPYSSGPFGAKGLGEPPMVGPAAAIINAVYDAVGVRIRKLPCLPEDVLNGLKQK